MPEKRERWDSRPAFILAAIGSAIGLGNVWRFPYIAYENGGGAFLIPYFIALLTAGIPILILEMAIGQRFQAGAATAMRRAKPWFQFVGWWAVLIASVITCYYCAIMAWSVNYLVHAFTLKWSTWVPTDPAVQEAIANNEMTLQEAFFNNVVIRVTDGPGQMGAISWQLLLGLVITWILIYLCVRKGVKSVGKVVLVTVPLPFLLLIILFFRGLTLDGAIDGLRLYLTPDFEALKDPRVWSAAYGQVFFSLSVGFGIMIAYASFRPKNSDVVNNAFITGLANCGTSFFAGFVVFSILGYMAQQLGKPAADVVSGGIGLAFVTFPQAISLLPAGQIAVGIIFFLMLLSLGIDSAFSLVEASSTSFSDELKINRHKTTVTICIIGFLAGLLFISDGGLHWLDIVDNWMNTWGLVVIAFLEALLFGWFFNLKQLQKQIDKCSEIKAGAWWVFMIRFVSPLVLGIIIIWNLVNEIRDPYGDYPMWSIWLGGWGLITVLLVISIILSNAKPRKTSEEVKS